MAIQVKNLCKKFGDFVAADHVNFSLEKGELVGLLGPSGSGKTTVLRMIAGLEIPDCGEIYIDGKEVAHVPAGKRGIGFVFQNYALFRHMSVYDNIAFGLDVQKINKAVVKERVEELIDLIGLKGLEKRLPHQLSGGQRQRVAFARALAPWPQLLLLDEPFAAIDAKVRKELRLWLREMISQLGITSIFVTHDQDEAVEIADEIIVMQQGKVEQKAMPMEIYKNPKTPFVATFLGESQVFQGVNQLFGFEEIGAELGSVIRPEFVEITKKDEMLHYPSAAQEGKVVHVAFRGDKFEVITQIGELRVVGYRGLEKPQLIQGEQVNIVVHRLYVFEKCETKIVENKLKMDPMPIYI